MDELKEDKVLAIFAISALLVSVTGSNFGFIAYADDLSENDDREEKQYEKELKEQHKEKIDEQKQLKNELRDEYKIKLEEKKIELEVKRKELRLLEHEFRENIKNLKLEAKEQFNELKHELKIQENDRKSKIRDRINELKEKYKDKIREPYNHDSANLENYPSDYAGKKMNVCHFPPGNSDNAHTINISVNAVKAHLAHDGDYLDECEPDQTDETDEGRNIKIELKEEIGFYSKAN